MAKDKLRGSKLLRTIFNFISSFGQKEIPWAEFKKVYRTRTPEEIISSGYFLRGCHEPASVLYWLVKELGVETRFVEMVKIIKESKEEDIYTHYSHCFVELNLNGRWVIIDPSRPEILQKYPAEYVFFSEGPDKWNSFDEFLNARKKFIKTLLRKKSLTPFPPLFSSPQQSCELGKID